MGKESLSFSFKCTGDDNNNSTERNCSLHRNDIIMTPRVDSISSKRKTTEKDNSHIGNKWCNRQTASYYEKSTTTNPKKMKTGNNDTSSTSSSYCCFYTNKGKMNILPFETFQIITKFLDFISILQLASCSKVMENIIYKKCIWLWQTINFAKFLREPALHRRRQLQNDESTDRNKFKFLVEWAREDIQRESEVEREVCKQLRKLTDNNLAKFLIKVNAKEVTKVLVLRNCAAIQGYGLHPIRRSSTLHHIDLRTRCDIYCESTGMKLDSNDVIETLLSMMSYHPNSSTIADDTFTSFGKPFQLSMVLVDDDVSSDVSHTLRSFVDQFNEMTQMMKAREDFFSNLRKCSTCYHSISDHLTSKQLVQRQLCWTCCNYSCQRTTKSEQHCSKILECYACKERHCTSCVSFQECTMIDFNNTERYCNKTICVPCACRQTCSYCLRVSCGCADVSYCSGCKMTSCHECDESICRCDVCDEKFCESCRCVWGCDSCGKASCAKCNEVDFCKTCNSWLCNDCDSSFKLCHRCDRKSCGRCIEFCTDCHCCDRCAEIECCDYCYEVYCNKCDQDFDTVYTQQLNCSLRMCGKCQKSRRKHDRCFQTCIDCLRTFSDCPDMERCTCCKG